MLGRADAKRQLVVRPRPVWLAEGLSHTWPGQTRSRSGSGTPTRGWWGSISSSGFAERTCRAICDAADAVLRTVARQPQADLQLVRVRPAQEGLPAACPCGLAELRECAQADCQQCVPRLAGALQALRAAQGSAQVGPLPLGHLLQCSACRLSLLWSSGSTQRTSRRAPRRALLH